MALLRDCTGVPVEDLIGKGAFFEPVAPASIATAGAATYLADDLLKGVVKRATSGASRTDILPTAALVCSAFAARYGGVKVGCMFSFMLINDATAAETITLTLGSGMTSGNAGTQFSSAIAQNATKTFRVRITNITAGSEACVIYA